MAAAKDASKQIETFTAEAQKNMDSQIERMSKGMEDIAAFSQDNVDAVIKSSSIAAKAAEGMSAEFVAFSKKAFEDNVAAAKDLAASKTISELVEKQTALTKASFDGFVKQATKMNELYLAAAKEVSEPLSARFTAASEAVKSYQA